jgi:ERCC4-type nuclease
MINLIIDSREQQLYNYIKERDLDKYQSDIIINSEQLELGDINICFDNYKYILERKTINDLLASIKDGRYKEQKSRLLASQNDITYIIEGDDILSSRQYNNQNILSSVYFHTMYRDNIKIIFTKNIQETCTFILTFCSKIIEKPEHFKKDIQQTSNDYVECLKIKSKKIDNITPDICYIMQLSQIPHISTKIAKNIQKKYSTMKELINILESTTDKIILLSNIEMIGKEKAKKILEYFHY